MVNTRTKATASATPMYTAAGVPEEGSAITKVLIY
jgi:hypothetical protein